MLSFPVSFISNGHLVGLLLSALGPLAAQAAQTSAETTGGRSAGDPKPEWGEARALSGGFFI